MDKMREEFEEYCSKEELGMTGSDCTGEYYNPVIEMLWHCWKSSRSAQFVKLPSMTNNGYEGFYSASSVIQALKSAGVRHE